jgi:hypothetical protein
MMQAIIVPIFLSATDIAFSIPQKSLKLLILKGSTSNNNNMAEVIKVV